MPSLYETRDERAQAAFEAYDFGDRVGEFDGWTYWTPGTEWRRTGYLEDPKGGDSRKVVFLVKFTDNHSADIASVELEG